MKAIVVAGVAMFVFCGFVFVHNIPNFCASPNGSGNWIVAPLCTEEAK